MNINKTKDYTSKIEGNACRFEALGKEGRIHLEGSGPIVVQVSIDGVDYKTVEHEVEFSNGIAIAPISLFIGDFVQISASTLTKVVLNYNKLKTY